MRGQPLPIWFQKLSTVLFSIFCFELGLFLLIFPWFGHWEINYFAWFSPGSAESLDLAQRWRALWMSTYFRGGVSGLGVVNIYIAIVQAFRLRHITEDPTAPEPPPEPVE